MTEYTVDKDGNVTSKGKGKKPLPTRYMEGDIPFTIPSIAKKAKSAGSKAPFLQRIQTNRPLGLVNRNNRNRRHGYKCIAAGPRPQVAAARRSSRAAPLCGSAASYALQQRPPRRWSP